MDDRLYGAISATLMGIKGGRVILQTPIFLTQEQIDHPGEWVMIDGYLGGRWDRGYLPEELTEYLRAEDPGKGYDSGEISLHGRQPDALRAELIALGWPLTFATQAAQDALTERAAAAMVQLRLAHDEALRTGEFDF